MSKLLALSVRNYSFSGDGSGAYISDKTANAKPRCSILHPSIPGSLENLVPRTAARAHGIV